VSNKDKI